MHVYVYISLVLATNDVAHMLAKGTHIHNVPNVYTCISKYTHAQWKMSVIPENE